MSVLKAAAELLLGIPELNLSMNQLFAGTEADYHVDPAITINTYGSEPSETTHDQVRPVIETPRIELVFRSRDYETAETLAERAYAALFQPGPKILDGMLYENFWPMDTPAKLPGPPDVNGRYAISFRVRARRKP